MTLHPPPSWPSADGGRALLRRWSRAHGAPADALPATARWTALGDGVEVRFEGTAFRTSDYWTLAMREAAHGGLEWPRAGSRPAALPPQGIEHRYAALATVVVHPHHGRIEVEDHRSIFLPLTSLTREAREDEHHRHHHHDQHHHHHHHHHHGEDDDDVEVTVRDGDTTGDVDVREDDGYGETVDVRVDAPGHAHDVRVRTRQDEEGGEDVRITIGDHDHRHEHERREHDRHGDHHYGDHPHGEDRDDAGRREGHHHHHADDDASAGVAGGDIAAAVREEEWREDEDSLEVDVRAHGYDDGGDVEVDVHRHGETVEVDVHTDGRGGGDDDVRVVVHTAPSIPAGFWIFGETDAAPEGFAGTGARLRLPEAAPGWRPRTYLPGPPPGRVHCVALDGAVFALGHGTREVLRYEPSDDAWRVETRLADSWRDYAVGVLDGRIHLVGGRDGRGRIVDWHRSYHPATGQWRTSAPLPGPRCEIGAAALRGMLYAAGGLRALFSMTSAAVDAYDPCADAWTECPRMPHGRANPGVAAAGGR
ncbi:MAG TPA: DUF6519 domain-containing protein, partial [Longimicrobium sp.]|nr:DUF6519 domain-containing protein [Longimicrobium sp.]